MERITIRDKDDVETFINAQDEARRQACSFYIASRTALRVAPYAIRYFEFDQLANEWNCSSKVMWRSLLTSGIASSLRTLDLKASLNAAAKASREFSESMFYVADNAAVLYGFTSASAVSVADNVTTPAVAVAAALSSTGNTDLLKAELEYDAKVWSARADQKNGTLAIDIAPLWSNENPMEQYWHTLRQQLRDADTPDDRGADWSFWIKWYDDILAGNPQNWDMLHEIATTPDIDWEASSREVNDKINGIVARYRLDEVINNHALDRKVVFNAQTNRLASEDIEARDLEDIVKSLRTALRRFVSRVTQDHAGNRMGAYVHAACELWIKRFRKEISKAKDSTSDLAHCVHMNLIELQKIIEIEAFQRDLDVNRLLSALEVVEQQIMVAAPEVLALRKDQNKVKIELYEGEYLLAAKRMTHGMMLDCEGPLEAVMAWVLYTLHDETASDAQKKAAIGFARGALPRGARELMMNDIDGSDPSKDTSLLKRMGEVGDAWHKTDKGIDALQEFAVEGQELITEGGPWVTEFLSKLSSWL